MIKIPTHRISPMLINFIVDNYLDKRFVELAKLHSGSSPHTVHTIHSFKSAFIWENTSEGKEYWAKHQEAFEIYRNNVLKGRV